MSASLWLLGGGHRCRPRPLSEIANQELMQVYAPATVFIDESLIVRHAVGSIGTHLRLKSR